MNHQIYPTFVQQKKSNMADHIDKGIRKILEFSWVYTFYQNLLYPRSEHLRYMRDFVRPFSGAKIMDIGCGPGTVLDYLLAASPEVDYTGFDFNERYIEQAQKKYAGKGRFVCNRVSDVESEEENAYDIVMANAVLHHLNNDEANHLYETAFRALKGGGVLVTFDPVFIPNQNKFAKWLIKKDRGQHVRTKEGQLTLARKHFRNNEMTIDHKFLRVPYTILVGQHYK